jgi:hypothetical protein
MNKSVGIPISLLVICVIISRQVFNLSQRFSWVCIGNFCRSFFNDIINLFHFGNTKGKEVKMYAILPIFFERLLNYHENSFSSSVVQRWSWGA